MRVVIVQPSLEDFYATPHRLSALGGFSVKALLEKQGHSIELINLPLASRKPAKKALPPWANHLEPYLLEEKGPLSYFTRWHRWGPEPEMAARLIHGSSPDIILISLFAHAYGDEAISLARACRSFAPGRAPVPLAVGGAGVTVRPDYFTGEPAIDLVLAGEGEVLFADNTLADLIDRIGRGGKVIRADRFCTHEDMVPLFAATTGGRSHVQAATLLSRGCPRGCRFCSNHLTQGRRIRRLDPVIAASAFGDFLESGAVPREKKLTLDLEDDNLLLDKSFFREVLDRLQRVWTEDGRREEDLFFTAENGMDYELLDRELLAELVSRGFRQFNFSLASADETLLAREKRFFSPERLGEHLAYLEEKGIPSVTYFICGLAGDSRESIARSLTLLHSLPTRIGISLFYPVPGLEGFTGPDPYGGIPLGLSRGSMAWPWTGSLSTESLVTAFRLSRFLNLLKEEKASREHGDLIEAVFAAKKLFTYDGNKKKIPVPHQDKDLVALVLEGLTCL